MEFAHRLIKFGKIYRELNSKMQAELAESRIDWEVRKSALVSASKERLSFACADATLDHNEIITAFKSYKNCLSEIEIQESYLARISPSYLACSKALDNVKDIIKIIDEMKLELPWQLRYVAEIDPEASSDSTVDFGGGDMVNPDGSILFKDVCSVCSCTIQNGLQFGGNYFNIVCFICFLKG